ncbi:hypothetical protein PVK06_027972 [Gossypium arboreum]|uniref:Uncharacterized protein n=1 Tax=Gossypium arboreum TaxID=29729 RepID=A0ABR0P1S9_GOSAR|nr:hypothetical protein PVK06_027972 [Gossypium arboreum]
MSIQFLCTRIALALNVSNVNTFRVVLLYAILQKKQIKESGPIFQEFARQNNIRVPNYMPDMSESKHPEHEEEEHESEKEKEEEEEEKETEEGEEDDEMDFEEDD